MANPVGTLKRLGELLRPPAGPKPTHTATPKMWEGVNVDLLKKILGRPLTEDDFIKVTCMWAGQLGHEKCGYCNNCHSVRWIIKKDEKGRVICEHPFNHVYTAWK